MSFIAMEPSGSKASSISGEAVAAAEDLKASLVSGADLSPDENSEAFSISREGMCAENVQRGDRDSPSCSAQEPKSKRARYEVTDTSSWGTKLDPGLWSGLDDYLLEKIFARLPFKSLFRISSLSKAWRLRISSDSFQNDVQNSLSALSWNSYAPLFVNYSKDLLGYESGSRQWHKLPTHSYLPQNVVQDWSLRDGSGSLLCWVCPNEDDWEVFHVHVTNPLMRTWKKLPPRPDMVYPDIVHIDWDGGSNTYKVVLGKLKQRQTLNERTCISVQIFDSKDNSWTVEYYKTLTNSALDWGGSIFRNGMLYGLLFTLERNAGYALISFDVKETRWNEIPYVCQVVDEGQKHHLPLKIPMLVFSEAFICGSHVMLLVDHMDSDRYEDGYDEGCDNGKVFSVFRLDLERGLAFEVSKAPLEMLRVVDKSLGNAAGEDSCIYIGDCPNSTCVFYNVETREWGWVNSASETPPLRLSAARPNPWRWTSVAYRPGLNPFVKV